MAAVIAAWVPDAADSSDAAALAAVMPAVREMSSLSEPRRKERFSVVTERSADVHPVPGSDRTCRANTVAGERCRRLSTADGLCAFHLRRQRESTVLDPLEIAAWDKEVAVLRVIDAGFLSGEPDAGSGRAGRAVP